MPSRPAHIEKVTAHRATVSITVLNRSAETLIPTTSSETPPGAVLSVSTVTSAGVHKRPFLRRAGAGRAGDRLAIGSLDDPIAVQEMVVFFTRCADEQPPAPNDGRLAQPIEPVRAAGGGVGRHRVWVSVRDITGTQDRSGPCWGPNRSRVGRNCGATSATVQGGRHRYGNIR